APDALEDDRACQDLARVSEEELEQCELRPRELDRPSTAPDFPCAEIELEVREAQYILALVSVSRTTQQRAKSRQKLRQGERLGQVSVRSCIESGNAAVHLCSCRQHEYGHLDCLGAETPADLEPVDAGHENVEDPRVRVGRLTQPLECLLAVLGEVDLIPLELE